MSELPVPLEALAAALPAPLRSVERTGRGGNSRVFRVACTDGSEYAAKFYFRRADTGRSRLDVEYAAISYMWRHGIRCIPQPVAANGDLEFALYEFVAGSEIDSAGASAADLEQLLRFTTALKELQRLPESAQLPPAADAGLSLADLHRQIETRLQRLGGLAGNTALDAALADFLAGEFAAALAQVRRQIDDARYNCELPVALQTLSPSDFGFHNALRRATGELVFLDFEFFGRDDPAKMIADFLLHPGQTLTEEIKRCFVQVLLNIFAADHDLVARLDHVYPLVSLKWCMIMLNEFVPSELARREFAARSPIDSHQKKSDQLAKAKAMLAKIMNENTCFPYRECTQ